MRISPISHQFPKINFGSKKTLYTNFDGTYFPFTRSDIKKTKASQDSFTKMYKPFQEMKENDSEFNIIVTTDRTKNDYLDAQQKIERAGLDFCSPDGLITSNGTNSFYIKHKDGQVQAISTTEDDPYDDVIDKVIQITIKTNPDTTVFQSTKNGPTEMKGDETIQSRLKELSEDRREEFISIVRDGKGSVEFAFSKKADDDTTADVLQDYIERYHLPYTVEHYENSPFVTIPEYFEDGRVEDLPANIIRVRRKTGDDVPDKIDAIKAQIIKAVEEDNGDMVICAGSKLEDERMLNPINYADLLGVYQGEDAINKDSVINNGKFIQGLKRLPFRSIVVGDDPDLNHLRAFSKELEKREIPTMYIAPDPTKDFAAAVDRIISGKEPSDDDYWSQEPTYT